MKRSKLKFQKVSFCPISMREINFNPHPDLHIIVDFDDRINNLYYYSKNFNLYYEINWVNTDLIPRH